MTAARSSTVLSRKLSIIADKSIVSAPRSYIRRVASTVVALRYVYTPAVVRAPSLLYSYLMSPILTQLRNINVKSDMIIHTITRLVSSLVSVSGLYSDPESVFNLNSSEILEVNLYFSGINGLHSSMYYYFVLIQIKKTSVLVFEII